MERFGEGGGKYLVVRDRSACPVNGVKWFESRFVQRFKGVERFSTPVVQVQRIPFCTVLPRASGLGRGVYPIPLTVSWIIARSCIASWNGLSPSDYSDLTKRWASAVFCLFGRWLMHEIFGELIGNAERSIHMERSSSSGLSCTVADRGQDAGRPAFSSAASCGRLTSRRLRVALRDHAAA